MTKSKTFQTVHLLNNGKPANFVFKTMEAVEMEHKDEVHVPHRHNYYTVIWVTKGTGIHYIDFKTYVVNPDTLFFISPEQVHDLQMQAGHSGYVMLFTTDFLEQNGIQQHWLQESGFFSAAMMLRRWLYQSNATNRNLTNGWRVFKQNTCSK